MPSVALFVSIPEDIHREFYRHSVTVTLKDKATQPSSALWHAPKLAAIVGGITVPMVSQVISLFLWL